MVGDPVRLGLVGVGMASQLFHLPHYADNPRCRIVAIAEQRSKLAAAVAAYWRIPEIIAEEAALFDRSDIDAVVIVGPRGAQAPLVLQALQSGKHVLAEKPMAYSVPEAAELLQAARCRDLIYAVGFMKRHDAGVVRAKALLDELRRTGELGALLSARVYNFSQTYGAEPGRFIRYDEKRSARFKAGSSGPDWLPQEQIGRYDRFLNVASHDVNLLRYLVGDGLAVSTVEQSGDGALTARLALDTAPILLDIAGTATGAWHEGAEFLFERGRLSLELPSPVAQNAAARVRLETSSGMNGLLPSITEEEGAFRRQARAFIDDVRSHTQSRASGADALGDMILIEEIWAAV